MEKSIVAGDSITSIVTILGRSRITIYSEIKRGSVVQIRQGKACIVYVVDSGQLTYEQRRLGSFNAMKLGNIEPFICWIGESVYKDHWSLLQRALTGVIICHEKYYITKHYKRSF